MSGGCCSFSAMTNVQGPILPARASSRINGFCPALAKCHTNTLSGRMITIIPKRIFAGPTGAGSDFMGIRFFAVFFLAGRWRLAGCQGQRGRVKTSAIPATLNQPSQVTEPMLKRHSTIAKTKASPSNAQPTNLATRVVAGDSCRCSKCLLYLGIASAKATKPIKVHRSRARCIPVTPYLPASATRPKQNTANCLAACQAKRCVVA